MSIQNNTTQLQNLLEQVNELPDGGAEAVLQEKTVDPSTTTLYVTPDSAYDGLSKVTVNAMTVVEQAVPIVSVGSGGKVTARATQTAGYVVSGTKTGEFQMTTQSAKTVTPSTSEQTAVASGVYTTGAVKVGAIPSSYVQPSGTKTITENGTHDVTNYASAEVEVAGEDVTAETNAYTTELAELTTAVTALEEELAGKAAGGGGSDYEIGSFTVADVKHVISDNEKENVVFPFIIGQTWQEWINSYCNTTYYLIGYGFQNISVSSSNNVQYLTAGGYTFISIDGTSAGCVALDDEIQNGVQYLGYFESSLPGDGFPM